MVQQADSQPNTAECHMAGSLAPQEYSLIPMSFVDICVDNIIGATRGSVHQCLQVTRAILHSLDKVFCPLEPTDLPECQEPISLKKLDKGDGCMSTKKTVLGWYLNMRNLIIHLTARWHQHLLDILDDIPWTWLVNCTQCPWLCPEVGESTVPYKFASSLTKNKSA